MSRHCYSVCYARKLTLKHGFFQVGRSKQTPSWNIINVHDSISKSIELSGVRFPCEIHLFDIDKYVTNQILKSYVRIGKDNVVQIFVNSSSNFCWQRYYICKEIIHIIASTKENSTLGYDNINAVIEGIQLKEFSQAPAPDVQIEHEANLGAVELLMPKEMIETEDASHPNGYNDLDIQEIAYRYKVPKMLVKWRLTKSEVRTFYERCYQSYEYKNADFLALMQHSF